MAIRVGLAVCFMPFHFDRIVLPSLPNRYALDGLVVSVNHDHVPLGRGKQTNGKQPVGKRADH